MVHLGHALSIRNCGNLAVVQTTRMYVFCMKCQIDIELLCLEGYAQM